MSPIFVADPHVTAVVQGEHEDLWTNFMRRVNEDLEDYHAPAA